MDNEHFVDKFAKHICEFLDNVPDMPKDVNLQFTIQVKKIGDNKYHLSSPSLGLAASQDSGLILN